MPVSLTEKHHLSQAVSLLISRALLTKALRIGYGESPEGVKWELGFAYFYWDLPIFSLGKWDLGL